MEAFRDAKPPGGDLIVENLAQEINTLTAQIDVLQTRPVPQYTYDPKTNRIVVEYPANASKVPCDAFDLRANRDQNNNLVATLETQELQDETALLVDIYSDVVEEKQLTPQQRAKRYQDHQSQQPDPNTPSLTGGRYIYTRFSQGQTERILNGNQEPQRNTGLNNQEDEAIIMSWIYLRMPSQLPYMSAGQMNNISQGFLHSFLRHWDQWQIEVPGFRDILLNLQSLSPQFVQLVQAARNAPNSTEATTALNDIATFLNNLKVTDPLLHKIIWNLLYQVQCEIITYMQAKMKDSTLYGEGVNNAGPAGQVQVYFRVGSGQIMVVGVSEQLHSPTALPIVDGNGRPIRAIITVYFITENDLVQNKKWIVKKY